MDFTCNEGDSYTIKKNNLTIKNGNVKKAMFTVEGQGVKLENLKGIQSVIVDEKVGGGNFSLVNCYDVGDVYVNGGGSESVHIDSTTVKNLTVKKADVRIALDGDSAKVESAYVFKNCKFESENSANTVSNIVIAKDVDTLNLAGKAKIKRIVTAASSIVVKVDASVKIEKADKTVKESVENNNSGYQTGDIGTTELTSEEMEKFDEDKPSEFDPLPPETEMKGSGAPVVDENETEGIRINFTAPDGFDPLSVKIEGLGQVFQEAVKDTFFYPFVEKGKTYKVRLEFVKFNEDSEGYQHSGGNSVVAWKDLEVTPKGGKGEVLRISEPEISFGQNGDFTLTASRFTNESKIADWRMYVGIYNGTGTWEEEGVKWKWLSEVVVNNTEFDKTHNVYLEKPWWQSEMLPSITFVDLFTRYEYTDSKGKSWNYKWAGKTKKISLPKEEDLWQDVKTAGLDKVKGTWKSESVTSWQQMPMRKRVWREYTHDGTTTHKKMDNGETRCIESSYFWDPDSNRHYDWEDAGYELEIVEKYTETLLINSSDGSCESYIRDCVYSRADGLPFTQEEQDWYAQERRYIISADGMTATELGTNDKDYWNDEIDRNLKDAKIFANGKVFKCCVWIFIKQ